MAKKKTTKKAPAKKPPENVTVKTTLLTDITEAKSVLDTAEDEISKLEKKIGALQEQKKKKQDELVDARETFAESITQLPDEIAGLLLGAAPKATRKPKSGQWSATDYEKWIVDRLSVGDLETDEHGWVKTSVLGDAFENETGRNRQSLNTAIKRGSPDFRTDGQRAGKKILLVEP